MPSKKYLSAAPAGKPIYLYWFGTDIPVRRFGQIFGQIFCQMFCQMFGQRFGQAFGKIICQIFGKLFGKIFCKIFCNIFCQMFFRGWSEHAAGIPIYCPNRYQILDNYMLILAFACLMKDCPLFQRITYLALLLPWFQSRHPHDS